MLIALQLVSTPQGPVDDEPPRRFKDTLVTIGRAPNCQVVLPDSLRIISRQHARLSQQGGAVLLTCLSASAPVRVNDVSVPHGGALPVHSGDVIHIGGFDLCMTLQDSTAAVGEPVLSPAVDVPLALLAEPVPAPVTPAASLPVAARRVRARLDEWFDLEPAAMPNEPSAPAAVSVSAATAPPAAPVAAMSWAHSADVDLDLRTEAGTPAAKEPDRPVLKPLQEEPAPPAEAALADRPEPTGQAHAAPVGEARAAPVGQAQVAPTGEARAAFNDDASAAFNDTARAAHNDEAHAALMQAFLEGAGLAGRTGATSTQVLTPMALTPAWMRHIGELLRASVEGSLALLHSRSTVKREMRAEVTVIARRQNNPLKFAPDALAALAHLVAAKRSPGFLEPVAALKDAHEDLLVHHLAVVAGMRAAMFELIARLGPDDVLRDEGPAKGLAMTLPTLHEAALWRRHRQRHADMTARLDDDFDALFGREFTKAYEAQARLVREKTPPEGTTS